MGDDTYNKRVNIDEADQEQSELFDYFFLTLIARLSWSQQKTRKEKMTFLIAQEIFIKVNS